MDINRLKAQLSDYIAQRVELEDQAALHRALGQDMDATRWEQQHLAPVNQKIDTLKTTISRLEGNDNVK